MAAKRSEAVSVVAGGREVRVSSPERTIFPATDHTPSVSKLQVCGYFAAVGEPMLQAVGHRPTAMERWPDGWHAGARLATRQMDKDADGFYQKRLPKGAPDYIKTARITFPSGRSADEMCPTEPAVLVWAAQMGTLTFHPWAVRCDDVDHPDELRIDLDPQEGAGFGDAQRVAEVTRELLVELGLRGYVKTSGSRGVHIYVRIQPRYSFDDVRHAAIGVGRELERRDAQVTTNWWKELRPPRSIFIDYNQNARDRTIASAFSLRARPGAPASTPMTWQQLAEVKDPAEFNIITVPDFVADGYAWADMDNESFALEPLLQLWETSEGGELNYPPDYPKQPNEPPRVQPSKKVAAHWDAEGKRI